MIKNEDELYNSYIIHECMLKGPYKIMDNAYQVFDISVKDGKISAVCRVMRISPTKIQFPVVRVE